MRFRLCVGRIVPIRGRRTRGVLLLTILCRWSNYRPVRLCSLVRKISGRFTLYAISARAIVILSLNRGINRRGIGFREVSVSDALSDSEIMVAELRIVQSMDSDGSIHVYDVSQSNDGSDLEPSKALELIEWARASVLAPMVYGMIQAFAESVEDEGEEY